MLQAPAPHFTATLAYVPGGKAGAIATVAQMRKFVRAAVVDPAVINFAVGLIYATPEHDQAAEAEAVFRWVQRNIRYVRDIAGLETVADPRMTLQRRVGDCDDQSALAATLLEAVGYPTRFVMGAYHSNDFEHVYLQVLVNGEWVSLDTTVQEAFGWEAPDARFHWYENV